MLQKYCEGLETNLQNEKIDRNFRGNLDHQMSL